MKENSRYRSTQYLCLRPSDSRRRGGGWMDAQRGGPRRVGRCMGRRRSLGAATMRLVSRLVLRERVVVMLMMMLRESRFRTRWFRGAIAALLPGSSPEISSISKSLDGWASWAPHQYAAICCGLVRVREPCGGPGCDTFRPSAQEHVIPSRSWCLHARSHDSASLSELRRACLSPAFRGIFAGEDDEATSGSYPLSSSLSLPALCRDPLLRVVVGQIWSRPARI